MAEIAGLVFGASALCSTFKACFQGYELLRKAKSLPSDAEYLSSKLIIEECRLLLSGRALGLVKDEAAIQHDEALGDPAFEPSPDWLHLPETRKIVEQSMVAMELLAKTVARLKEKYSLSEISTETWEHMPYVPRPSSQLIENEPLSGRAVLRRASTDSLVKNLSVSKKTQWAAMDKEKLLIL